MPPQRRHRLHFGSTVLLTARRRWFVSVGRASADEIGDRVVVGASEFQGHRRRRSLFLFVCGAVLLLYGAVLVCYLTGF